MKKMKKILLLVTCAFVLLGTTACGSRNDADNGADQSSQDGDVRDENSNVNDATKGDGIIDDAVDDVTDGVDDVTDDVTDGVDKATDDLTEDNGVRRTCRTIDESFRKNAAGLRKPVLRHFSCGENGGKNEIQTLYRYT